MSEVAASTVQQAGTKTTSEQKNGVGQRKCACGQYTVAGGECEACRQKRLKLQRWDKGQDGPALLTAGFAATATTVMPRFGVDFTRLQLRAPRPVIQRMPGDETASLPDAAAVQEAETVATAVPAPTPTEARPAPEPAMPESTPAEPTSESTTPGETAGPDLLVEDEALDLGEGQMRKSEFLAELRPAVCAAADAELVAAGRN
jgi:hypothetical protein